MNKKRIEKLVEEKKKEEELRYFDKYSSLFHDAYGFLSRKKALLYGGTALNELLPASLKIYEPYTLPDIDVLSPYAEKLANEMVRFYKTRKHQAVSFTEALHPGTYKVYADGVQIADITKCSDETYEKLREHSVISKQWKIKIVPPQYIRMTLHKILSQPNDAHRWENVYERLMKFYKEFPIKTKKDGQLSPQKETIDNGTIINKIYELLPPETVYFGHKEIDELLNRKTRSFQAPIQAFTDLDLIETVKVLKQIPGLSASKVFTADNFVPRHIIVYSQDRPIATIYRLSSCVAFNEYKKKRIASINAVIDILLSMSMSNQPHFKKVKTLLESLADELSRAQQKNKSKKKVLKQIVTSCYGPSEGIITMRRERAKRLRKKKKASVY